MLTGGVGADYLNGGDGFDFARYDTAASGVTAKLDTIPSISGEASGDDYVSIEGLSVQASTITLIGDSNDNYISPAAATTRSTVWAGATTLAGRQRRRRFCICQPRQHDDRRLHSAKATGSI